MRQIPPHALRGQGGEPIPVTTEMFLYSLRKVQEQVAREPRKCGNCMQRMASSLDESFWDDARGCWKDPDPRVPKNYQRFSAGAPELARKYENADFEALIIDQARTQTYTEEMLDTLPD